MSGTRGQSVVEFALILPVLMILIAVTLDLGRLAFARVTLENAAREGAFQASKTPTSYVANQPCPSPATTNLVICRTQLESRGSPIAIAPSDIQLTCSPSDCSPGIGNTVTVGVTGTFRLLTPLLSVFFGGSSDLLISSSASTQIETLPDPGSTAPWATPTPDPSASASPSPSPTGACQIPSAGFSFGTAPANGKAPLTLSVLDTSTFTTCSIDTWEWVWGDGTSFFGQAPGAHNYGSPGNYAVTLTVTNAAGRNTTGAVIIRVKP